MCGIFGYTGPSNAQDILIEGLRRLEYRGYDSAGVVVHENGGTRCVKALGKIKNLSERVNEMPMEGTCGIGHTRWATHGVPSEANSHPHMDTDEKIFVVHNGIIENYQTLKKELQDRGIKFRSETDTEVIAHLLAQFYKGDLKAAVFRVIKVLRGAFAVAVIHKDEPGRIVAFRFGSPLVIGVSEKENLLSSDVSAMLVHTRSVIYLNDGELADIRPTGVQVFSPDSVEIKKAQQEIDWDISSAEKSGYEHYMLKEIFEQPTTIQNSIRGRIIEDTGNAKLGGLEKVKSELRKVEKMKIVACGTARHAGLVGQYLFEELSGIATEVDYASEFRYRKSVWDDRSAVLAISQSGETADTLAAIREANEKGVITLGITNTVGSTLSRETTAGVYNHIGPEISVASSKAFTSQLVLLVLMAVNFGRMRQLSLIEGRNILQEVHNIPDKIQKILQQNDHIRDIANRYKDYTNFGFLGRKYNYPIAIEGALKLKEISYIHSEGYPSGELKHGSIALIDPEFPSMFIAPNDSVYDKNISNMEEIASRKGRIIAVATEGNEEITRVADDVIYIPDTLECLTPLLTAIPMQLFAYHVASLKGLDIDQPRNLAKSVTVE